MEIYKKIIKFLYPSKCCACDDYVAGDAFMCASCFKEVRFSAQLNKCLVCGEIQEFNLEGEKCNKCRIGNSYIDRFDYVYEYNDPIKQIIRKLKFSDQTNLIKPIASIMVSQFRDLIAKTDIILYVPMHKSRLKERFFNQAALIAKHIAKKTNKNLQFNVLIKSRNTLRQTHLDKSGREKNIKSSFQVRKQDKIKGLAILLIDDVSTTGATLNECARVLKKAEAREVSCLTFAKTFLR